MADDNQSAGGARRGNTMDVRSGRWRTPHLPGRGRERVPAADHLEQFVPLLVDYFDDAWWQRGSISLHFVSTTVGEEPVCAYLERETAEHCRIWLNAEGEALIARGTGALDEDPDSELRKSLDRARPGGEPVLLAGVEPGRESSRFPLGISAAEVDRRLPTLIEPMRCYREADRFGARVVPPNMLIDATRAVEPELLPDTSPAERLVVCLELRYLNGPVLCDRDYRLQGRVLAVAASERDEVLWYQTDLSDGDGTLVAQVAHMERFGREGVPLSHSSTA